MRTLSFVLNYQSFVNKLYRFDGHFIAIGFKVCRLHFDGPCILYLPYYYGFMIFVEQANGYVAAFDGVECNGIPPCIKIIIALERAALHCNVAELLHARHFCFDVFRAAAVAVLDRVCLYIQSRYLCESDASTTPFYLEVKLRKRIIR